MARDRTSRCRTWARRRRAHLGRPRTARGAGRGRDPPGRNALGRRRRRRVRERGRQRCHRRGRGPGGARRHPARHGLGLRAHVRHPARSRPCRRRGAAGGCAHDRCRGRHLSNVGGRRGPCSLRERRERGNLRRDRTTRQRVVEGARRQGLVLLGHARRVLRVAGRRDARDGRRRDAQRPDDRRDDLQRSLPRRRDDDVSRRGARRRRLRRAAHRRRDEARPGLRPPQDLQGQAPPPPSPRAPPRQCRHRRRGRTASDRARRRAAGNDTGALRGRAGRACGYAFLISRRRGEIYLAPTLRTSTAARDEQPCPS